jgi:folate-binding protein YgfZ
VTELHFAPADPARGVLRLSGADRASFLQGLVSNDIRLVSAGRGVWTALLTPQGKYLHDFFVTELDGSLLLDAEGARSDDLARRLMLFKLRAKIGVERTGLEVWHAWGDGAGDRFGLSGPGDAVAVEGGTVLADPRHAALGLRLVVPAGSGEAILAAHGFVRAAPVAWDWLRLALGIPDGSRDMILDKAILLENGFDELAGIAWDKGCWMGQELTARTKYRGLVKKRLVPVRIDGPVPAPGTPVLRDDGSEAGEIRSGQDGRALALIRLDSLGDALFADQRPVEPVRPDWARW